MSGFIEDSGFGEAVHELAIVQAIWTDGDVDTLDPKFAVVVFDIATGLIGVVIAMKDLFLGGLEEKMLGTEIAFG